MVAPLLVSAGAPWHTRGGPRCDEAALGAAELASVEGVAQVDLDVEQASARFRDARSKADLPEYAWNQGLAESELRDHADALALFSHARDRRANLEEDCRAHDRLTPDFDEAVAERIVETRKRLVSVRVELGDNRDVELCVVDRTEGRRAKLLLPFPEDDGAERYLVVDDTIGLVPDVASESDERACRTLARDAELLVNPGKYCFQLRTKAGARFAVVRPELRKRSGPTAQPTRMVLGAEKVDVVPGSATAKWYEGVIVDFPGLRRDDVALRSKDGEALVWLDGPTSCGDVREEKRTSAVVAVNTPYEFSIRPQRGKTRYVQRIEKMPATTKPRYEVFYRKGERELRPLDARRTRVLVGLLVGLSIGLAIGLGVGLGVKPKRELRFEN